MVLNKMKCVVGTLGLTALTLLLGCGNKVVTVSTIEEGQPENYIEIQEFELKEIPKETGREDSNVKYCAVLIPEGYQESEEVPGMYLHKMAPMEASNIYYTVSDAIDTGYVADNLTKEEYQDTLVAAMKKAGQSGEIKIESFEEVDFQDVPAYKIKTTYKVEDGTIEQLTYLVLADQTYTITYSQSADDDLMADFEISDDQIKLIKEESVQTAHN